MFGIIASIFGSKKVIETAMNGIDALVFTNQEKSKMKIELLKSYEPFKIAQRIIALGFMIIYSIAFLTALIYVILNKDIAPILNLVKIFGIWQIMGIIIGFYFAGGVGFLKGKVK